VLRHTLVLFLRQTRQALGVRCCLGMAKGGKSLGSTGTNPGLSSWPRRAAATAETGWVGEVWVIRYEPIKVVGPEALFGTQSQRHQHRGTRGRGRGLETEAQFPWELYGSSQKYLTATLGFVLSPTGSECVGQSTTSNTLHSSWARCGKSGKVLASVTAAEQTNGPLS